MMKKLACAVAVVALALTGCGGSLCEDLADTFPDLNEKVKDCPSFSDVTFEEPTDAEIDECKESLEDCSDSDKEIMEKFIDCTKDLPKCTASTEQSFATSFLACAAPLENVSNSCGASGTSITRAAAKLNYSR